MASQPHLDDDDDFGGDFPGAHRARRSGTKRSFGDLEDEDDDIFGSKKGDSNVEENAPGVTTGMILSLRERIDRIVIIGESQSRDLIRSAVRDLKAQLKTPSMQARRLLLDTAIHEEFTRLKNLVEEKDTKVKELQDNISAVSFTPQSKMGKMLMAKCRTLQEENEEICNQAAERKVLMLQQKSLTVENIDSASHKKVDDEAVVVSGGEAEN